MKKIMIWSFVFFLANSAFTQHENHTPVADTTKPASKPISPRATVMGLIGNNVVNIDYGSPSVRNRQIWNGLVAFDQVWATGAHKATWITFTHDVTINNILIPNGKYGFYTIPGKDTWTLILNKKWDMHLADEYDIKYDIIRLITKPEQHEHTESLTYGVKAISDSEGIISMAWEKLFVSFAFKNTLTNTMPPSVPERNKESDLSSGSHYKPKLVHHDLYIKESEVNFTGKPRRAIVVNQQIPMPTLIFTEGDTAEIYVHNELNEETSLHWHGLFLPNKEDGVPNLTQMPIKPHSTHIYRFPIIQHGTHWYHSHSGLQEQIGMYGNFVMLKKPDDANFRKGIDDLPSFPIVLSEWTDYNPKNVHRMLHNATDWFALKKNAVQSYGEAIQAGHFKTKVKNEWKRMLAMDVSDVYYDKILMNGAPESQLKEIDGKTLKAGDQVRLRISNGGASSYFWLRYAGGKFTVIANDGNDVKPVEVDRLIIAVSETYDIIVTIPADNTAYELLATTEDRTNSASMYIGNGIKQLIEPMPRLKYFEGMKMMNSMMKMNGNLDDMGMQMSLNQMDMNVVMYPEITGALMKKGDVEMKGMSSGNQYNSNALSKLTTLNYAMLQSATKSALPEDAPIKELKFELTGNMNRYVWSLDNKVVSEADKILIKKGENVRMVIYNGSMMRHPMHLHGHDFRLLNGKGEYAPLKNIVDIMPMETDTLEFNANVEGDWFFHCHILYHMMSGMGRVLTYENQAPNPLIPNPKLAQRKLFADDRNFHLMAENDFATNGNDGMAMIQSTRWSIGTEWRLGYHDMHGYETETHLGRYLGKMQWIMPFIGFDWRYRKLDEGETEKNLFGQVNTKDNRTQFSLGLEYTLPMLVKAQAELYHDGNVRLQLMREDIPISKRLRAGFMVNSDKEYMIGFRHILSKNLGISAHYDSDMGIGLGLTLNY